jgi:hypothetical protein
MSTNITDYPNVRNRLAELGCNDPRGFAILPVNFESAHSIADFRNLSEAATVKKLLRNADLPHGDLVDRESRPPYIQNNTFEWVAPTLFISGSLASENPYLVSVALGTIANYVTGFLNGFAGSSNHTVKVDIVVEQNKTAACKKITYEGPPEGLKDLAEVVRATSNE